MESKVSRRQLLGVLLTSTGSLALEVVLTRIFSVKMWYHFAFLAISVALMGSSAAGVLLYAHPHLADPKKARRWIKRLSLALALSVPLTFLLYLQMPFSPVLMNRRQWLSLTQTIWLVLIYLDLSVPFFLSGMIIALALSAWSRDSGRIYWADLVGASFGCLASVVLLNLLGGSGAVLAIAVIQSLAGLVLSHSGASSEPQARKGWRQALLIAVALVALMSSNILVPWLRIRVNKAGGEEPQPVYERWNSYSRVTVYEPVHYPFFWGISAEMWDRAVAEGGTFSHALLLIDAVAGTPIQNFNGDLGDVRFLRYDLTSFVYHLVDAPETLVIGPGGGRDVLAALATDAPHVAAVEVNPAVIAAVRGPFADFAGHLYDRPDVEVVVADARGYVERSPVQYDVIQASLIDTWAAGGSGAFALSENSLYTAEAFEAYYQHLTRRGYLSVSRWYLPERPAETLRLVSTGMEGWRRAGVSDPRRHVAVIAVERASAQTEGLATVLFKREPFTPEEIAALAAKADELGYTVLYAPGLPVTEEVGVFITADDHVRWVKDYPLDISPATDDRPFFFNLVQVGDLFDPTLSGSGVYRTSMEAFFILLAVVGVGFALGTIMIGIMVGVSRRRALSRLPMRLLGYFALLGVAFMMIEIPTIQRFTVYLGRPVYSLSLVLFSLLLSSGMGSLWSSRWSGLSLSRRVRAVFVALLLVVLIHPTLSAVVIAQTLRWPLGARIVVTLGLTALLGFWMGMPFPTGIRWVGSRHPGTVPWAWAVNGAASVIGSALATGVAIHIGLRLTALVAALLYGIAGGLLYASMAGRERGAGRA